MDTEIFKVLVSNMFCCCDLPYLPNKCICSYKFKLSSSLGVIYSAICVFFHHRSELHNPTVTVRYGLIIESYLKANPEHIHLLYKQFEGLNKLNGVSQLVKAEKIFDKVSFDHIVSAIIELIKQVL